VGVDCSFVAEGRTPEEVKQEAFAHAGVVHADMMKSMSQEQVAQLDQAVQKAIKQV
jgi:predicted small metal-binding protein